MNFKTTFAASALAMAMFVAVIVAMGAAPLSQIITATDTILYEAARKEALSVSFGYDAGYHYTGTVTAGNNTDVAITLDSAYMLRLVSIYCSAEASITYTGAGIDCVNADNGFTEIIPAGKSVSWDFSNVTSINVSATAGADVNYEIYVRAARPIASAP